MYDLEKINYWMKENNFFEIEQNRTNGLMILNATNASNDILNRLAEEKNVQVFTEQERQIVLYFYLFICQEDVSLYHLMNLLSVSRGTVNEDLKKLSNRLREHNLQISYTRLRGYFIEGKESDARYMAMLLVANLVAKEQGTGLLIFVLEKEGFHQEEWSTLINNQLSKHQVIFSDNGLLEVNYIIAFVFARGLDIEKNFCTDKNMNLNRLTEYRVAESIIQELSGSGYQYHKYLDFITSLILSYSTGDSSKKTESYYSLRNFVYKIFLKLEVSYGINLTDKEQAFEQIYAHFRPAYYRIIFQYPIVNPLKTKIQEQYSVLFKILKDIFDPISLPSGDHVSDDELAYLTIHFATLIKNNKSERTIKTKAAIICPNGTGVSLIIYKELKSIFPEIEFLKPVSIGALDFIMDEIDVIFSTNLIKTSKPLFIVRPIMTNIEKANLIKNFYESKGNSVFMENNYPVEDLLKIVDKYTDIRSAKKIVNELNKLTSNILYVDGERRQPMLSEIINAELIQLHVNATDWKDAIRKSSIPLVKQNKITENYVDAMITSAEESGPYIVITKNVALPHARPEEGVRELAISLTTLESPVEFGNDENDPVKYIFCLSATDNTTHLKAISELVDLLGDSDFYRMIEKSQDPSEIINYIQKIEKEMSNV
ncbi:BglG family transcription antiterminator [Virgibacillus necropolis]|nr:BglG family transcription antiterminator [Virgibacillus necropolis]